MDSDKRKSILYDRQASREENDLLISRMDSVFQAAKLRNTLFDKPEDLSLIHILTLPTRS